VKARSPQAAGRAGLAIKVKSRAVKAQVSTWGWPQTVAGRSRNLVTRGLAVTATRYPALYRAWKEFLRSFSLSDRPAQAPPSPPRAATLPQAPRRAQSARSGKPRSNMRKAA
jgi:hypothetical protein